MIGAVCVNTLMHTTPIVRLTLVDIWKDKIRQDELNLIMNEPLNVFNYIAKAQ